MVELAATLVVWFILCVLVERWSRDDWENMA